ncbi:MAG: sigma-70 family RNA polymerase sigma factor, partial [Eubacteriales bacterium]|nr:sigma-70 family RNA polymerase sigma factor [Eubacteriales bacterium]
VSNIFVKEDWSPMDYLSAKADPVSRNRFLEEYRVFVRKIASAHCRRLLEWGRDEELSIAMIALDSAIDGYQPDKGAKFETFASIVIKRRLIDFQRSMQRLAKREVVVEDVPAAIQDATWGEEYLRLERAAELQEFAAVLDTYGISFTDLARESPSQQAVRDRVFRVARLVAGRPELVAKILEQGRLPLEQISQLTGETSKTLGKRRRYLIALLLVAAREGDFPFISSYLQIGGDCDG